MRLSILRPSVVFVLVFVASTCFADSINEKIVAFCKANVGKQVDDGQCSRLAEGAIEAAGAKPQSKYEDAPAAQDYVWGKLIAYYEITPTGPKQSGKATDVQPGDIVQFRDTTWKGFAKMDHHTAVVSAVKNRGTQIDIYHQNVGGKKVVRIDSLNFFRLESGWVRIYRPEEK